MIMRFLTITLMALGLVSTATNVGSESALADFIRPTLKSVGGFARVYYAGTCSTSSDGKRQIRFPTVSVQSPRPDATGTDAVRQIFRDDPNVEVSLDQSGMLRVTSGTFSTAILQTRIRSLVLDSLQQYNAQEALHAIWNTPEIGAAGRSLRLSVPFIAIDIIDGGVTMDAPHLPDSMQNVTVDDALDSVARTFKGVIFYGFCQRPDGTGLYRLNFIKGY